jgi:hypothetical protein
MQPVLHQKCIVYRGENGEDEGGAQENLGRDQHQHDRFDQEKQNKKDGCDLGERIGLAKNTGAEIAQAGNHKQHAADQQYGNIPTKHNDCVFPRNQRALLDREHEKHGAHQQLVGDRIKILAKQRLLMQGTGEKAVEPVAQSGENEQRQRPSEIVLEQIDDDEWQKDHPQQRELVGCGQDLTEIHRYFSPQDFAPASFPE